MELVGITECSARDGVPLMRNSRVSLGELVKYINKISQTGVQKIDCVAFTHPRTFPKYKDAEAVMAAISKNPAVLYVGLVPNEIAFRRAAATDIDEMTVLVSASEEYNRFAMGKTIKETVNKLLPAITQSARDIGKSVQCSILASFGCPFSAEIPSGTIEELVAALHHLGIREISLVDSTGLANPKKVKTLVKNLLNQKLDVSFSCHFHDTRGLAIANALAAYEAGINMFSTSLAGFSFDPFGWPDLGLGFGNIPTEDLVQLFESMDISTGVDLDKLLNCVEMAEKMAGTTLPGHILRAGTSKVRISIPKNLLLQHKPLSGV